MVSQEDVIEIIKYRSEMQSNIRAKIQNIYRDMEKAEAESIECMMSHPYFDKLNVCNSRSVDVLQILEKQKRMERKYNLELRMHLCKLQEDLYTIQRTWICYQSLKSNEYEVLHRLYEQKQSWKSVERGMNLNHRALLERRKAALQKVVNWSNSLMTNAEIIKQKRR